MATPGRASNSRSQPNRAAIFKRHLVEPDEIRLMHLQPADGSDASNGSTTYCRLSVVSLTDHDYSPGFLGQSAEKSVGYEALSWCWGEDEDKVAIKVCPPDEAKYLDFYVSKHLNSALQSLRHPSEKRSLWVDAICIDQGNTTERNSQVPKMDRVYGQASSVCVWVGEADDSSGLALSFIRDQILKKIWEFDEICANKKYTASWAALINLMSRRWFSRVSPSIWRSR